jgi:hypothetical protein
MVPARTEEIDRIFWHRIALICMPQNKTPKGHRRSLGKSQQRLNQSRETSAGFAGLCGSSFDGSEGEGTAKPAISSAG